MKKSKSMLSLLLAAVMVLCAFPMSASAESFYSSYTIDDGKSVTYSDFTLANWSGSSSTFTNNGTVTVNGGFYLDYHAHLVNNGTLTVKGNPSTMSIASGCSFTNKGVATFDNSFNLGFQNDCVNEGTIYLYNITSINVDGLTNNGTIVCGDGISSSIFARISAVGGTVVWEKDYDPSGKPVPTPNNIEYDLNGGSWVTTPDANADIYYYGTDGKDSYTIGVEEPFKDLNKMVTREHYTFVGWTCDKEDETEPSKYLAILSEWACKITLTAHWKPTNYNVRYNLGGGYFKDATDITSDGTYFYSPYNIESSTFTLPTPVKDGYTFAGWMDSRGIVTPTVSVEKGTTGNIAYTAQWTANGNTPYTVNVYYMDTDGNYSTTPDTIKSEKGVTDTTATVNSSAYVKTGFMYDSNRSINKGNVTADGSLVISLYYAREQYDISFMTSDGSDTLYNYKAYFGANIAYNGKEPTQTLDDYICTFAGWTKYANSDVVIGSLGVASQSATYYAVFDKEQTKFTVSIDDFAGFADVSPMSYKVDKGKNLVISLHLADGYCFGTDDHALLYSSLYVGNGNSVMILGKDYTVTCKGNGEPVVLTIPNITSDLSVQISAFEHSKHDFDANKDKVIAESTCKSTGTLSRYCYMCGATVTVQTDINSGNHTALKHIDAKSATTEANGNIEYWHCEACGKYFSDKDGKNEIMLADTAVGKIAKPTDKSPQTGDNGRMALWFAILFASAGAFVGTVAYGKKRKYFAK